MIMTKINTEKEADIKAADRGESISLMKPLIFSEKAGAVLEALLYRGIWPRGDVPGIVGTGERQARRIVSALIENGVVASQSSRAPLLLAFPARLASRWMPGLFPERV